MIRDTSIDDEEMAIKEGPQYLLFYLSKELFGFRAEYVSEIVELPVVTKVPWMQECIKGVCNIRGSVVGVIDLGRRLGKDEFYLTQKSALVILSFEYEETKHRVGVVVDEVVEIEVFEGVDLQTTPKFGLDFASKYVESMANYKDKYIPILSLQDVVSLEELSILKEL